MDTLEAPTHFGPPPAEVTLLNGQYDPTTGRCSNVTCHNALGATGVPLIWTQVDSGAATCGACHGVPPPGHGPVDCVHCHAPTAGPGLTIREPMNHVNGTLDRSGAAVIAP
jgi:predicted CxxxxCH...CXXCH cytochrome family protein